MRKLLFGVFGALSLLGVSMGAASAAPPPPHRSHMTTSVKQADYEWHHRHWHHRHWEHDHWRYWN